MNARNPPRYERGIIITKVLITVLSMRFSYHQERFRTSVHFDREWCFCLVTEPLQTKRHADMLPVSEKADLVW